MRMQLSTSTLAIFAIFAVMGLIGAVTIELVAILEAEAKCKVGSTGFNASQGRCNPG